MHSRGEPGPGRREGPAVRRTFPPRRAPTRSPTAWAIEIAAVSSHPREPDRPRWWRAPALLRTLSSSLLPVSALSPPRRGGFLPHDRIPPQEVPSHLRSRQQILTGPAHLAQRQVPVMPPVLGPCLAYLPRLPETGSLDKL